MVNSTAALATRVAVLLVDLKKAFPSTIREACYFVLLRVGVPQKLIDVLKSIHDDCSFFVSYNGEESAHFQMSRGFREGGVSSPLCFNVVMNILVLLMKQECQGVDFVFDDTFPHCAPLNKRARVMNGRFTLHNLLFADDITNATFMRWLEHNEQKIAGITPLSGHEVHPKKTERMLVRKEGMVEAPNPPRGPDDPPHYKEVVKVVGGHKQSSGLFDAEVHERLAKSGRQFGKWRGITESMDLTPLELGNLMLVNVCSVLTFNCQRAIYQKALREYQTFMNKVVRYCCSYTLQELQDDSDKNQADLRIECGIPHVQVLIENLQIRFVARILRKDCVCRRLLFGKLAGSVSNATPQTARYYHDLLVRVFGPMYMGAILNEGRFEERVQKYLLRLRIELDWYPSVQGGKRASQFSVRYRRSTLPRAWDFEEYRRWLFEEGGNPEGLNARVEVCHNCTIRLLVVDEEPATAQSWRSHKRDFRDRFRADQFDAQLMWRMKRYWCCMNCDFRSIQQSTCWEHVQGH
jgi:hypothetical protein